MRIQYHFENQYFNEITPLLDAEFDEKGGDGVSEFGSSRFNRLDENYYLLQFEYPHRG